MLDSTKKYIVENNLIDQGTLVFAALSGGADSVCMLILLNELKSELGFELKAIHVEHGIRGAESQKDAEFAAEFCDSLQIECKVIHVDVPSYAKERGLGHEEAARILRYEAFENCVREADAKNVCVAVAHHMEDNAETVIFQMLRGSGARGLCGIRPMSQKNNVTYIRPILCASRNMIEDYLLSKNQKFVTDSTNSDTDYSRNKIRHEILPVLKQINERATEHINESARMLAIQCDYIDAQTNTAFERVCKQPSTAYEKACKQPSAAYKKACEQTNTAIETGGKYTKELCIEIDSFLALHPALQTEVAHKAICEAAGRKKDIGSIHVKKLLELTDLQTGRHIDLPYGLTAYRRYGEIVIKRRATDETHILKGTHDEAVVRLEGAASIQTPISTLALTSTLEPTLEPILSPIQQAMNETEADIAITPDNLEKIKSGEPLIVNLSNNHSNSSKSKSCVEITCIGFNGKVSEIPKKTYTKWFDYDKIKKGFLIRKRRTGDYLIVDDAGHRQKLKQYFVNAKIPADVRDDLWLVADDSQILAVLGARSGKTAEVTSDTKTVLQIKQISTYGG